MKFMFFKLLISLCQIRAQVYCSSAVKTNKLGGLIEMHSTYVAHTHMKARSHIHHPVPRQLPPPPLNFSS